MIKSHHAISWAAFRFKLTLICFALVTLNIVSRLPAQQLEPALQENSESSASNLEIQRIYNLTEVAKSVADYERIAARSEKLLKKTIFDKDKKYLESLTAWSRNRLAKQHAKNAASMMEMGLESQANQELQRAIKQYDLVIAAKTNTWRAWMGRAIIHAQQGEYESALEKFVQVTKLNRKHNAAWFNCAETCLELQRHEDAIKYYTRLIDSDPTDVQARTGRGHCYLAIDEWTKAKADYHTVVKLKTDNENALCNLGDAYQALEMWDEALASFEKAAKSKNPTVSLERLSNLLVTCPSEKIHDPARAVTSAKQAMENAGDSTGYLETLAAAYSANGQKNLADEIQHRANQTAKTAPTTETIPR